MDDKSDKKTNYRELQAIAKRLQLPGNLKHHLLLEIIEARKTGKEYIVNKILNDQKIERVRRKKEKLEAREAAYQHLRITQDKKTKKPASNNQPLPDSSTVSKWSGQSGFHATNIRSLLSMPMESLHELMRKSREQEILRSQNLTGERPLYYSEYQEALGQRLLYSNQNILQDSFQAIRDDDTSMREELIGENGNRNMYQSYPKLDYPATPDQIEHQNQQPKRTSFQMRDILGQSDPNWCVSYGQSYCMGGAYETNTVAADVTSIAPYLPDSLITHYPPFIPSSEHWRNVYEVNQDNYNWRFLEYSGFQGVPGPSTEPASSPNSDTVSATDEDLPKDLNHSGENIRYNVQVPVHQNYFVSPSEQNEDYQESTFIPDLPTVIEETHISESTLPADRACKIKMCVS